MLIPKQKWAQGGLRGANSLDFKKARAIIKITETPPQLLKIK